MLKLNDLKQNCYCLLLEEAYNPSASLLYSAQSCVPTVGAEIDRQPFDEPHNRACCQQFGACVDLRLDCGAVSHL